MIDDLSISLQSFKTIMNYRGLDFDGLKVYLLIRHFDSFTRHLQFPELHVTIDLKRCWVKPSNDSGLIPAR